jgi:hypothetical protein
MKKPIDDAIKQGVLLGLEHAQVLLKGLPIFDAIQAINAGIIQRKLELECSNKNEEQPKE